jgi:predicted transcriptional regulator
MTKPIALDDPKLAKRLAAAAAARGRTPDDVAAEAIAAYLDWDEDFRAAVARGLAEAEAGAFATADEVERVLRPRT